MNQWHSYELLKARWIERHPNATPAQYQAAMRRIARRLRI